MHFAPLAESIKDIPLHIHFADCALYTMQHLNSTLTDCFWVGRQSTPHSLQLVQTPHPAKNVRTNQSHTHKSFPTFQHMSQERFGSRYQVWHWLLKVVFSRNPVCTCGMLAMSHMDIHFVGTVIIECVKHVLKYLPLAVSKYWKAVIGQCSWSQRGATFFS